MGYSVTCEKFSSYHYHYHRQNIIYSSPDDKTIPIQIFNEYTKGVNGIEFSPFNCGRYLFYLNSNVICLDHLIIQFVFGIFNNKNQLYVIKVDDEDGGIIFLKSLQLKKNEKKKKINGDIGCGINLC
ncbi:hypothetical protein RFI_36084 [Reticulomyxa filosa]|uniref:Uncharacterized protein n=1 Tax=Reticulomyxa filosa TaxID=46433 RepID=X6LJ27_RETFI|nr:hypothetical protein RFI_36084 [Reticulomyxa filosa]|eukprot:ETO01356.1 hypothetical protein RFI_36084 [Reticulomyxa filosa]